jgi:hypothetical protein
MVMSVHEVTKEIKILTWYDILIEKSVASTNPLVLKVLDKPAVTAFHLFPILLVQEIQCVPLATEPSISLKNLTPMKILQRNLNRGRFVV